MTSPRLTSLVLAGLLATVGCGKSRSTPSAAGGPVTIPGGAADGSNVTVESRWCLRCHGDASRAPLATDAAGVAFAPPVDASGAATGAKVGAHLAHLRAGTLRATGVPCATCHVVPADAAAHTPGVSLRGALATTRLGSTPAYTPTYSAGTCANTYCHGKFNGGLASSVTWTDGALDCTSCHAMPPAVKSDGVSLHANNPACGTCHPGYTNNTVDPAAHINGAIDLVGGCTACHGTFARPDGNMVGGIYDENQAAAPPDAVSGSATGVLVGVHLAHVNPNDSTVYKPIFCTECHPDNASGSHSPNGREVTFAAATGADLAGFTPSYVQGNGTSTATTCVTYCHGDKFPNGNGSVATWGWNDAAPATCGSCHGDPPAFQSNGTTPHTSSTTCGTCHAGYTNSTVVRATHIDGIIQVSGCTGCHGTDGRPNALVGPAYDANQAAAPPAATTAHGAANAVLIGVHLAHVNPGAGRVYAPILCTECHPDNTTGTHPDNAQAQVQFTLATGADLATYSPTRVLGNGSTTPTTCAVYCHDGSALGAGYAGSVVTWAWNGATATCGSCHADPPTTAGHTGAVPPVTSATNCGLCHPGYTATTVDLATHINGRLDGGESTGGQSCGGCHLAIFSAMNGTTPKAFKHALGNVAGTNDSATDSGLNWASPLANQAPAVRSCVNMCHQDHPHDLGGTTTTHEYNVYADNSARATSPTSTTRAKTDFDGAATNGGICVSCHRSPITAGRPTIDRATFDASAHDFTQWPLVSPTWTWQFQLHTTTSAANAFNRNCTKCHSSPTEGLTPTILVNSSSANSVHFNDNPSLLAGKTNPAAAGASGFICYNCHGLAANPAVATQGNRSGKNIQGQIAKAARHPAEADTVHDSAAEFAAAAFGNELGVAAGAGQRHASCMDCHDTHATRAGTHATPGNLAGPPVHGQWGAQLSSNPTFWTAPAAGNFTKKAMVAGTDLEATLCFKCHSSFYGTLPTSPSGGYTETDTAREFNPANVGNFATTGTTSWQSGETAGGFHPVLASAGANLGAVSMANLVTANFPWRTTGARNTMTCTDCHESNTTTDPNGPHGSAASFLLRGPNTAWSAALLNDGTMNGAFCANCHSSSFSNSRFPAHTRGDHSIACFKCHAAIPHGGPRPGMLNAGAGANANVGGTIAGWDNTAPYWQGGTGDRLYIQSYPATNATNWSQSNCGCNGTGH